MNAPTPRPQDSPVLDLSDARIAIVGPRAVGKTQFLNAVRAGKHASPLGGLFDDAMQSFEVQTLQEKGSSPLRRRTFDDVTFQPYQRTTDTLNVLEVAQSDGRRASPSRTYKVLDYAGAMANTGRPEDAAPLAALASTVDTVIMLVPYWSVLSLGTGQGGHRVHPTFDDELTAWVGRLNGRNIRRIYVLLNQFSRDYYHQVRWVEDQAMNQVFERVSGLTDVLNGMRVVAAANKTLDRTNIASRYLACFEKLSAECFRLLHDHANARGEALLERLFVPGQRRVVHLLPQNTLLPYEYSLTGAELSALFGAHHGGDLKKWQDELAPGGLTDDDWDKWRFYPVHDRLTWLPFFLAALAQDDARLRW